MIIRKSAAEIDTMARAGRIVSETLALVAEHAQPGITTAELDAIADRFIRAEGGIPTFKGYRGYPAATCLSPNDMVVHGIPGPTKLSDGDILSVDVGVTLDGFVADSAWTYAVGTISPEAQRLLDAGDGFGAFLLPARVAGEDDVAPPLQHRGQAVEGLAPHDHRAAHGELFEAAQVGGQVPGNLAPRTDHAIGGACEDQRDIRAVHRGEAPTQVTWPSLRPSRTSVLP